MTRHLNDHEMTQAVAGLEGKLENVPHHTIVLAEDFNGNIDEIQTRKVLPKTPSFYVHDDRGFYKCFSTQKSGDIFTFLQETERMTFAEAVEKIEMPGLQLYSGNFLDGSQIGRGDVAYHRWHAFCLEAQHFPDTLNHPTFPSAVLERIPVI